MKRENGLGCIVKLGGQRKRPYAIRITEECINGKQKYKYLSYHESREDAEITLNDYLKGGLIEGKQEYHHKHNTRIYRIWWGMVGRCEYPNHISYKYYGARGIKVCEEWRTSFQAFYDWAMVNGYTDELTIDRIDNDKGYEPTNCRWITIQDQQKNKRPK